MLKRLIYFALVAALSFIGACYTGKGPPTMAKDFGDGNLGTNDNGEVNSIYGWSTGGALTQANSDKKVSLQCHFAEPGVYTVAFDMYITDTAFGGVNDSGGRPINCTATLYWMVAGNEVQRKVSVGPGVSISGVGEGVRVSIADESAVGAYTPKLDYSVVITVAKGQRGDQRPALLNGPVGVLATSGGGSQNQFAIPFSVGIKGVIVGIGSNNNSVIPDQSVQVGISSNQTQSRFFCDPRQFEIIPIPPGSSWFSVLNTNAGFTVSYSLAWVIDG